ncbi:Fructosamine kinase-domain-containing protein [Xylariomycetidae sp. FL0641]|nr:Fructosamine kinase-domain-containing protein [Xylariomycetidae sp. FL0641]
MPTDKTTWNKEIPIPPEVISYVDEGILNKLPSGTQVLSISPSGASYWVRTAKIGTLDGDGEPKDYFVKVREAPFMSLLAIQVHQGPRGRASVYHEFHTMSIFRKVSPDMVAEPIAYGSYRNPDMKDTWFFISRFHKMSDDIPDVHEFPRLVAEMHEKGVSPDGRFGFPFVKQGAANPLPTPLCDTWEECFTRRLKSDFENEDKTQGCDPEIAVLKKLILRKVVPRLLRPLETEGRKLIPRLCHGDLWDGNASTDMSTGQPMIFDPAGIYAHHEYELAPWRCPRHQMTDQYIEEYCHYFPPSQPAEDFEDRLRLYMLRFDMLSSSLYPGNVRFRE